MEPVIIGCDGCGIQIRIRLPNLPRNRSCPLCKASLDQRLSEELVEIASTEKPKPQVDSVNSENSIGSHCPEEGTRKRIGAAFRAHTFPHTYAGALLFLTVTASLFADALGSLGADEPSYDYRVHQHGNEISHQSRMDLDFASPGNPPAAEFPKCDNLQTTSPLADLPDSVFAESAGSGLIAFGGELLGKCGEQSPMLQAPFTPAPEAEPGRIRIRDREGRVIVARVHGKHEGESRCMLPDGQLGIPNRHVPTDEPFRPLTHDELHDQLKSGPFSTFQSFKTTHYLIFYQSKSESSLTFAERSGDLLENLYKGLTETFRKRGIPTHELEFPLVVVIFDSEKEFRAHKKVAPDVQAYYEIYTNRIYFYETSERDRLAPEFATLRKPQTVAHEGTHQILANIGVQPRLGAWPLWLTEGLAEYCASPVQDGKGNVTWNGLGRINALHMATIRDLEDPRSMQVKSRQGHVSRTGRDPGKPLLESLIRAEQLSPTDYALAWAMTHYLALKRGDDFVKFLVEMSKLPPLETRTADDQVAAFKKSFGNDLAKLDKEIARYLAKLAKQKGYDHLPYYAVMFEQPIGNGMLRRAAMVSQSPSMIQQWVQEVSSPRGAQPTWHAIDYPSRSRASMAAESFMQGY